MIKRVLILMVILGNFLITISAQKDVKLLSPNKMQDDLKDLIEFLEAHPDPYSKSSEEEFNNLVSDVEGSLSAEMSEIEYFKNVSKIVASISDGHSSVQIPKLWLKGKRKEYGVFPYEVFLTNSDELFVIKTYGDTNLSLGAQILEINGMPINEFISKVTPYISFETIPFRNDQISESFELMLYLIFDNMDQLSYRIKGEEELVENISTIPYKEWKIQKKDLKTDRESKISSGQPYDFSIIKPGIAKIDIFSFAVEDIDNYTFFLDKTFKDIEKNNVHSLIIDVRGNYGGWPKVASELFHYIYEGHFKTMAKSSMKISYPYRAYYTDKIPALRSKNIVFPRRRHYVNFEKVFKGELNTYVNEDAYFNESPITKKHEFNGNCFLLIDRKSYSASSSFAATFQCYTMGTIIGEPTGGTKIFRANSVYKTLPNSGLRVSMATTKLFSACYNEENEPVTPNFEAIPTVLEKIHEVDSQLNAALLVIKRMQRANE